MTKKNEIKFKKNEDKQNKKQNKQQKQEEKEINYNNKQNKQNKQQVQQQHKQQELNEKLNESIEINENEKLFWKIWRNNYIKSILLSNLSSESKITGFKRMNIFKYNEIVSVQWMLRNGYKELLKYKVKRGDYLIDFFEILNTEYFFSSQHHEEIDINIKGKQRYSIFKEINNNGNDDDIEFYNCLFNNYPQYFIKNKLSYDRNWFSLSGESFKKSLIPAHQVKLDYSYTSLSDYWAFLAIKYDNIAAFSILSEKYQFSRRFTAELFYEVVDVGSTKIAKYIFRHCKFQKNDIIGKVWKSSTFIKASLGEESIKDFKILNKIIKFLIVEMKLLPPKEINKIKEDIFQVDIKSLSVGELFECCYSIALILENTNLFDDYLKSIKQGIVRDKYQGFTGELQNYLPNPINDFLSIIKLNEMLLNIYENNTITQSTIVGSISISNKNILNLFKMLITFTSYSSSFKENFVFFNCKYLNNFTSIENTNLKSIEFGKFESSISIFKDNRSLLNYCMIIFKNDETSLLKYCNNQDIEKDELSTKIQIQFISQLIQHIKESKNKQKIKLNQVIEILLKSSSNCKINLIKMLMDEFSQEMDEQELLPINLFELIESTEIFDYFLNFSNKFQNTIGNKINLENCLKSEGYHLMNHIKKNHKLLYQQFLESTKNMVPSNKLYEYSLESLLFIYNNMNDFYHCYENIDIWKRNRYFNFTLDQYIQLVNGTPLNEKYAFENGNSIVSQSLEQLHWVKLNRPHDLVSRCGLEFILEKQNFENQVINHQPGEMKAVYQYFCSKFDPFVIEQLNENLNNLGFQSDKPNYWFNLIRNRSTRNKDQLFMKICHYIGKFGDIQTLSNLMKLFNLNDLLLLADSQTRYNYVREFFEYFVANISIVAAINGQISVLLWFKSNYPWLFDVVGIDDNDIELVPQPKNLINTLFYQLKQSASINNNIDLLLLLKDNLFKEYLTKK